MMALAGVDAVVDGKGGGNGLQILGKRFGIDLQLRDTVVDLRNLLNEGRLQMKALLQDLIADLSQGQDHARMTCLHDGKAVCKHEKQRYRHDHTHNDSHAFFL